MLNGPMGLRFKRVVKRLLQRGILNHQTTAETVDDTSPVSPWNMTSDEVLRGFYDVLFINGCDHSVPHPVRYRVAHQMEQLESMGVSTAVVDAWQLLDDHVRTARVFVVFRCPYFDGLESFINLARSMNKRVYFDIDDLVIDTSYTDQIPYVAAMAPEDKALYDDGVIRYGKSLSMCDGVITTTRQLAKELQGYSDLVFINRNVASQEMVGLSLRAVSDRDTLAPKAEEDVSEEDYERWKKVRALVKEHNNFTLAYFSGSITHNSDFELIAPAVLRLMREHEDIRLMIVGELELSEEFDVFKERVDSKPFLPWRELPDLLANIDVNLAPLEDTVFNRAKSENKWVEAGLVGVPTVASGIGAFAECVTDGVNGLLCNTVDEWYETLLNLYQDEETRYAIGKAAQAECLAHHVTVTSGRALADFIVSHRAPNAVFVFVNTELSGGVIVAMKHASILRAAGNDVCFMSLHTDTEGHWADFEGERFCILSADLAPHRGHIDKMIATMWVTVPYVHHYFNLGKSYYLVQSKENWFYDLDSRQFHDATATYGYGPDIDFCTISPWCKRWLEDEYGKTDVRVVPNGIDLELFSPIERDWSGKIRILVEGDSESENKNVDESFRIIDCLDPERYEVWYLSYRGKPKEWYRVDRFLHAVPHDEVADIYRQCHILLKTSILESWSYPPLEMMATGGQVIVLANEGNVAYLVDGHNALLFDAGEDERAVELIEQVVNDVRLRERLRAGGLETAKSLNWDAIKDKIVDMYE